MIELSDVVGVDVIMVVPWMLRSSDGEHGPISGWCKLRTKARGNLPPTINALVLRRIQRFQELCGVLFDTWTRMRAGRQVGGLQAM